MHRAHSIINNLLESAESASIKTSTKEFAKKFLVGREFIIGSFSMKIESIGQNRTPIVESFNGLRYQHGYQHPEHAFEYVRKQLMLYVMLDLKFSQNTATQHCKEYQKQLANIAYAKLSLQDVIDEYGSEYWCNAEIEVSDIGVEFRRGEVSALITLPMNRLARPIVKVSNLPTLVDTADEASSYELISKITARSFLDDIIDELSSYMRLNDHLKKLISSTPTLVDSDTIDTDIRSDIRNFVNNRTEVGTEYSIELTPYTEGIKRFLVLTKTTSVKYNIDVWNTSDGYSSRTVFDKDLTYCEYWSQHKNVHKNLTQFIEHFMKVKNILS